MCAILGFNFDDDALAKKMCKEVLHRGPDGGGIFTDKHVTLGHRRLSIIDLSSGGKQPKQNNQGDLHITFNGEIYNYLELKKELKSYKFKSDSDTEIILAAYEKWGEKCVEHFNGMWAFAIYDSKKKKIFLSRDRMGQKPLYYYCKKNKFIFASQIKSILKCSVDTSLDQNAIQGFYHYGYTPQGTTTYKKIKQLLPGHNLTFDLKKRTITIKKYYNLKSLFFHKKHQNENSIVKKIQQTLDSSVKYRLIGDVPIGAFLSGGVDSSAIVATIRKFKKDKVHTFSIGFDDSKYDETKYAKIMAEYLGTRHHTKKLSANECFKIFKDLPKYYDQPFADSSMIPTTAVSRLAKKHVTVSLSGDAADECFGGYQTYKLARYVQLYPSWLKFLPAILKKMPVSSTIKQGLTAAQYANLQPEEIFARIRSLTNDQPINTKFTKQKYKFPFKNWIDNLTYCDQTQYLPEDILAKVDRASMSCSLEARCPILDPSMLKLQANIDGHLKIKGTQTKYIFKKAVSDRVPNSILKRRKQGFSLPIKEYINKDWKNFVEDNLATLDSRKENGLPKGYLTKILNSQKSGYNDYSWLIYSFVTMNQWFEKWT